MRWDDGARSDSTWDDLASEYAGPYYALLVADIDNAFQPPLELPQAPHRPLLQPHTVRRVHPTAGVQERDFIVTFVTSQSYK